MTAREARRALRWRVPVQTCGATAITLYGSTKYRRIAHLILNCDDYGREFWTVELIDEFNEQVGRYVHSHLLTCPVEDVKVADDAPETLRSKVYLPEEEGAAHGTN